MSLEYLHAPIVLSMSSNCFAGLYANIPHPPLPANPHNVDIVAVVPFNGREKGGGGGGGGKQGCVASLCRVFAMLHGYTGCGA